jgi:hypothetical protein
MQLSEIDTETVQAFLALVTAALLFFLKHYTHVLDQSAEFSATTLSPKVSEKGAKKGRSGDGFAVNWQPNGSQEEAGVM